MRILYVMHVSWGWIKQRPHFLAEELAKEYRVDVVCKRMFNEKKLNANTSVHLLFPFRLPFERFGVIKKINDWFRNVFLYFLRNGYDIYWFTAPTNDSTYLLTRIGKDKVVVYDCMDDMLAFPLSDENREQMAQNERVLYNRANIVFCSSQFLKDVIGKRYPNKSIDITVVNNALILPENQNTKIDLPKSILDYISEKTIKIVYLGTISEWIDFELCNEIVKRSAGTKVYMWGPYKEEAKEKIKSERIVLCGPIDHKYVYSIMENADILIMPFVLNELILSVNPVKLYEYILSGRPCLAPLYGESKPFGEYVYLYENKKDCVDIINSILNGTYGAKQKKEKCLEFAKANTWRHRGEAVKRVLGKKSPV